MGFTGNQHKDGGLGKKSLKGTELKLDDEMAMEVSSNKYLLWKEVIRRDTVQNSRPPTR